MTNVTDAPFEALRWVGRHWVHIVIAPVVVIVFTMVHEFSHAVAVWVQGGRVTEFSVIPGGGLWGYVRYEFDAGASYSPVLISLMPYAVWWVVMGSAAMLATRPGGWRFAGASTVFIWGWIGPFGDIVNAWGPWLMGSDNDFASAFGEAGAIGWLLFALVGCAVAIAGWFVQRGLYGERSLSMPAYGVLALLAAASVGAYMFV